MDRIEQEFTNLVKKHKGTIYTVCYMFAQDKDEVADLFQEILINIWNGIEKFREESSVRTWIWRISFNTCVSYERKKTRRVQTVPLSMNIDLFDDTTDDIKQIRMLHKRIGQLDPFDRAIVLLWLENLSYAEIGEIVGISEKNVSVRLVRIKEQLKRM
ncbi:MAG: sigma-70 family RNA polymerase sigma factor [Bacteroidales bacterium]|nr:sigma-70 family RNA polymerase sigma factor [Bacteroidales bacterium]MBO7764783.1 sigma-70 family RNA polymerase sigma factor [Bacteroidales bacterium]